MLAAAILIAAAACANSNAKPKDQPPSAAQSPERSAKEFKIITPKPSDVVSSPLEFNVEVNGKQTENRPPFQELRYELKNEDGSVIRSFSENIISLEDGHYITSFMQFSCPKGKTGTFEAKIIEYQKNGQAVVLAKATVPVKFKPETPYVTLYFQNSKMIKGYASPGATVFPVERKNLLRKAGPRAAILELLKGPTKQEQDEGYYSQVWPGTRLQSLKIKNGVIYADFSKELGGCGGGTDCQVPVQAPIDQTLQQFCPKQVVLTVDGSEGPLNP